MFHIPSLTKRIYTIITLFIAVFCLIILRLSYLQLYHYDHYVLRGEKNFLRTESIQSLRGNIVDRNGILLATNRPITNVVWNGSGSYKVSEAQSALLIELESILGMSILENQSLMQSLRHAERFSKQAPIALDISFEKLSAIKERFAEHVNIGIETHFKRHYPHGQSASHVLGYLHKQDEAGGKMGIEKFCNDLLQGHDGSRLKTINSVGRNISSTVVQSAQHGDTIQITIDHAIQKLCESIFPEEFAGSITIMDPQDGALLGWASMPSFNPAVFLESIAYDTWQEIQEKKPFLNRNLNPYPPGSIFKIITISAALEQNMIEPDDEWNCKGNVLFAGRKYWCARKYGHGKISTVDAIAYSCNTPFYEVGKRMDIDCIAHYASLFGLGSKTDIIFPEKSGIVPSRSWKREQKGEAWWPGETLSVMIGQSFLMTTPIQIARMMGAIFTGQLVKPRILALEPVEKKSLYLKKSTIDFLKESLLFAVTSGTGRHVNTIKEMVIYAKTSTAQTSTLQNRKRGGDFLEHAWFVAHFQYKEHKPLVIVILVEHAGSSGVATRIAKNFFLGYKKLKIKQ